MDSMRSLNTSLPKARKPRPVPQPDVHQTFKTAALTVTNLYKSALADLDKSRREGYQEALEDLISFLDKENLGVGDGEGWRIRQWAMEQFDGGLVGQANSDSDEEGIDEKRARSSSPVMERNATPEEVRSSEPLAESTHRSDSAPPPVHIGASTMDADTTALQNIFQFSSSIPFPSNNANDTTGPDFSTPVRRSGNAPRRALNRGSSRSLQRSAAQNLFSLGNGAGQKRKIMHDFFNIDNFNDRRDGPGGGSKRSRMP